MKYTTNLKLKKPDYTDLADIADINSNMDKIDAQLAEKANKTDINVFNGVCTYTTNYNLTIENNPILPNYFTVRFKAPNSYVEGKNFIIGSNTYVPKNANFETNDIVSVEFDKVNKKCFFKVGGVNETLPPQIENFNVFTGDAKLGLTWTISDATSLSGYVFTIKAGSIPNNVNDGVKYEIDKSKTSYEISGLNNGTKYYVRPFPYNGKKQYQTEYITEAGTPLKGLPISNLPVGSKVKFGKYQVESETPQEIIWRIAEQNHAGYPTNSVTLITDKIVDLRAFDAKEPNSGDDSIQAYGNNRYRDSNIRQWLNKNTYPWYVAAHSKDAPPTDSATRDYGTGYDDHAGFLKDFTSKELAVILDTTISVKYGGGTETVVDKVFLLSKTEVGLPNENGIAEGSKLALFSDSNSRISHATQQCISNTKSTYKPTDITTPWFSQLRTPYDDTSHQIIEVNTIGTYQSGSSAHGGMGIRPALNIKSEVLLSLTPDVEGCYTVL